MSANIDTEPSHTAEDRPITPPPGPEHATAPPTTPPRASERTIEDQIQTSPLNKKVSGTHAYSSDHKGAREVKNDLAKETESFFVGPMPVVKFLDAFLPWNTQQKDGATLPSFTQVYKASKTNNGKKSGRTEVAMYQPFVDVMDSLKLDTLRFANTGNKAGDRKWVVEDLRPDISIYGKGSTEENSNFALMEAWGEFKSVESKNAFIDPPSSIKAKDRKTFKIVKETQDARDTLGQMTAYAVASLGITFRTHIFSFFIVADKARFIRWDRAGAVVSESFAYTDKPELLASFFYRLNQLTPEQRGRDTTVCAPSADEERDAREALIPKQEVGESDKDFKIRREQREKQTLYKFAVQSDGAQPSYYVGPFSTRWATSLVGRASRGCPVYDLQKKAVYYLKDTWRIDSPDLWTEGKIYEFLHEKGVRHIASLKNHGDVRFVQGEDATRAIYVDVSPAPRDDAAPDASPDAPPDADDVQASHNDVVPTSANNEGGNGDATTTSVRGAEAPSPQVEKTRIVVDFGVHPVPPTLTAADRGHDATETPSSQHGPDPDANAVPPAGTAPAQQTPREQINNVHATVTQMFVNEEWVCGHGEGPERVRLHGYVHYRLVLGVVGRDLTSFRSTKEMLTAVMDAIEGHGEAFDKAGILHRDISPGNIMITDDGRGILIDWDLARPIGQKSAFRFGRTGTWQFISGALLQKPLTKLHTYADDLESFLHVATYVVMLYTPSSHNMFDLGVFVDRFHQEKVHTLKPHLTFAGGYIKAAELGRGSYIPEDLTFPDRPQLFDLLWDVAKLFKAIYLPKRHLGDDEKKQISYMQSWPDGGLKIHTLFKEALEVVDAWPTSDRPTRIKVFTTSPQLASDALLEKRDGKSNNKRPTEHSSYPCEQLPPVLENLAGNDGEEVEVGGGKEDEDREAKRRRIVGEN